MGSLGEFIEQHPMMIGLAIAGVAVLAYLSRNSSAAQATGGGVVANTLDPNAAAVQEANIAAGSSNLGLLASLIGGARTTDAQLALGENESDNALQGSLAETSAQLTASLASTAASKETADRSIDSSTTTALASTSSALAAATINAASQDLVTRTNAALATNELQQQKDIARASDNTSIVTGLEHIGEVALAFFGL